MDILSLTAIWASVAFASAIINPSRTFDADQTFKTLKKEQCTVLVGDRSTFEQLLAKVPKDFSKIKKALIGTFLS